jgi:hypothetical protein
MKKHEVIQTIVSQGNDNPEMMKSILGNAIFEAAKEALKTPICIPQIKPIIDSAYYLIRQIEICEQGIAMSKRQIHIAELDGKTFEKHSMNVEDYQRQKNQYTESLQKCLNQF